MFNFVNIILCLGEYHPFLLIMNSICLYCLFFRLNFANCMHYFHKLCTVVLVQLFIWISNRIPADIKTDYSS